MVDNKYILQSVDNVLRAIELLGDKGSLGVADIARELSLGKATVFRMMATLENRQYVTKDEHAKYYLGMKMAYLGSLVQDNINYVDEMKEYLTELRDTFNETAHMAILDGNDVIFIDKVLSNSSIQMASKVGARLPAYCTGTGKVLLSHMGRSEIRGYLEQDPLKEITRHTFTNKEEFLDELRMIRERGYGYDLEESEIGLVCYAVPVYDHRNEAVLAMSISGPSVRMRSHREQMIEKLLEVSRKASEKLGCLMYK